MGKEIVSYVEKWMDDSASLKKISVMPIEYHGKIFGIEIRFSINKYDTKDFDELVNNVNRRSGGTLSVLSGEGNYKHGVISYAVANENHGFSETKIASAIKYNLDFIEKHAFQST